MNLFVTGATGFIGSHFLKVNKEHELTCLKRKESSPRVDINKEYTWIIGELNNFQFDHLENKDALIHFAAHSPNPPYDSYENCFYWNVLATIQLFEEAFKKGIRKFIVAGTGFEYGKSGENYDLIPIHAPLLPTSSYPASKAAASIMLSSWAKERNVQLKILRIFQVYGEGELQSRLWPSLKKAAKNGENFSLTKGEQVRDFISVSKVAEIFLDELDFGNMSESNLLIKNIGSGKPQSIKNFAEFWWRHWEAEGVLEFGKVPYRTGEVMRYVPKL